MGIGATAMQRIRYGLTGLAFVFVMVVLGTAIKRSSDEPGNNPVGVAQSEQKSEPLAQLGVAPGDGSDNEAQPPVNAQGQ